MTKTIKRHHQSASRQDYKSLCGATRQLIAGLLTAGLSFSAVAESDIVASIPYTAETMVLLKRADSLALRYSQATGDSLAIADTESLPALLWRDDEVMPGDTLSEIFDRQGLGFAEWGEIMKLGGDTRRLERLRSGTHLRFAFDSRDQLASLEVTLDEVRTLRVDRIFDSYHAKIIEAPYDSRLVTLTNTIENSLFVAASETGLPDRLTMNMTNIFAWDIDFALDVRPGDAFTVVYEKIYKNGRFLREGDIMAAEFINKGRTVRAVRYTDSHGNFAYYSPDGHSMKKAFLRTPGDFSRVSSGFSKARKHPIKKVWRAHKGVDYAAPRGTKIVASGSGRVKYIGSQRGYGKVVIIDHSRGYSTLYAHMNKFAPGLSKGDRVKQGQKIGEVGMTGAATGPHLHYEFRVNGEHKNPLTVDLPMAAPIARRKMADFQNMAAPLISELDAARSPSFAYNHLSNQ